MMPPMIAALFLPGPFWLWAAIALVTLDMIAAVNRLPEIDRRVCRAEAERRFSTTAIVDDYEALYRELCRN